MVADVGFIRADKINVCQFMRYDSEQVAFNRVRMKVDHTLSVICCAFTQHFIRGPLDFDRPPFAVELEAKGWTPFALFHFSKR